MGKSSYSVTLKPQIIPDRCGFHWIVNLTTHYLAAGLKWCKILKKTQTKKICYT